MPKHTAVSIGPVIGDLFCVQSHQSETLDAAILCTFGRAQAHSSQLLTVSLATAVCAE